MVAPDSTFQHYLGSWSSWMKLCCNCWARITELAVLLSWAEAWITQILRYKRFWGALCTEHSSHISSVVPAPFPFPSSATRASTALSYLAIVSRKAGVIAWFLPTTIVFSSSKHHGHIFSIMALVKKVYHTKFFGFCNWRTICFRPPVYKHKINVLHHFSISEVSQQKYPMEAT